MSAAPSPSPSGSSSAAQPDAATSIPIETATATFLPLPEGSDEPSSPAPASPAHLPPEDALSLQMKWSGKTYNLTISASDLVYDLRTQIESLTSVPADAQKIVGLTRGKLSAEVDGETLQSLGIKNDTRFTLIGTPEHLRFKPIVVDEGPDVDYTEGSDINPATDPRNLRKIDEMVEKYPITLMNPPREGKKLLVLDIDYTLVDTKPLLAGSLPSAECARPGLHDFLRLLYPYYDIVLWSQTSWRWLEIKLIELGIIGGDAPYKIMCVADMTTMFSIFSKHRGKLVKHEVKPLAYFWKQFPQWSATNTIHIDDLSRNFAMNPGEGLRIRAFKGAATYEGQQDRVLDKLRLYLSHIAKHNKDFRTYDHSLWKSGGRPPVPHKPIPNGDKPAPNDDNATPDGDKPKSDSETNPSGNLDPSSG